MAPIAPSFFRPSFRAATRGGALALCLLLPAALHAQSYYDSQRQNREYQRLQDATQRAYTVPDRPSSSRSSSSASSPSYSPSRSSGAAPNLMPLSNSLQQLSNSLNRTPESARGRARPATDPRLDPAYRAAEAAKAEAAKERELTFDQRLSQLEQQTAARFTGSTQANCRGTCQETLTYANGSGTYVGNTEHGFPQGVGTRIYPDGRRATGYFQLGEPAKLVRFRATYPGGAVFVGGWQRDAAWNLGRLTQPNGDYDEGVFYDGQLSGFGVQVRSGVARSGEWDGGQPFPKGTTPVEEPLAAYLARKDPHTYRLRDGSKFEGLVRDGHRAQGKFTPNNSSLVEYEGTYDANDDMVRGLNRPNYNETFEGDFRNNYLYRGTHTSPKVVAQGQYDLTKKHSEYFVGRFVRTNDTLETHGFFASCDNEKMAYYCPVRYAQQRGPSGLVVERFFENNQVAGPATRYRRPNGDLITGLTTAVVPAAAGAAPDSAAAGHYLFIGLRTVKAAVVKPSVVKAAVVKSAVPARTKVAAPRPAAAAPVQAAPVGQPVALTAAGEWLVLPETDRPRAAAAAATAAAVLDQARAEYNTAVKWNPALIR